MTVSNPFMDITDRQNYGFVRDTVWKYPNIMTGQSPYIYKALCQTYFVASIVLSHM